jgi:hypothetical protein
MFEKSIETMIPGPLLSIIKPFFILLLVYFQSHNHKNTKLLFTNLFCFANLFDVNA